MKTKILVATILFFSCLTSWAWFPKSITQAKIDQIRVGQTTEADLVQMFGPPTTKYLGLSRIISLDWFRSVPAAGTYVPFIGELVGGLRVEAQQLSVVLNSEGKVIRYEAHSSRDTLKTGVQRTMITAHVTRSPR